METKKRKPVIWLAGDSTMQTYSEEQRPQYGWGEKLLEALEEGKADRGDAEQLVMHRADCSFAQQKRYEGKEWVVDNCAMAGRSSKTFREEGRLQDILEHILPGDYLLIQFGHNDAGRAKPERYVPLEQYEASIAGYVEAAEIRGAHPVLISSIALCPCPENEQGEAGEINHLLQDYAKVLEEYGQKKGIPYLDMGRLTRQWCQEHSEEEVYALYREDHVHLVEKGAGQYAALAVPELKKLLRGRNYDVEM